MMINQLLIKYDQILTKGVVDIKAVLGSPLVEKIGVVGRRDCPPFITTNLEVDCLDFEDGEEGKYDENDGYLVHD